MSGGRASSDEVTTQARLIRAAVEVFSSSAYDSASVREIERRAGANRGLVAYHFGSKDELWRAAVEWLMSRFHDEMAQYQPLMPDLSPSERARVLLKVSLRFHAKHPEYFRMLVLQGTDESGRVKWLIEEKVKRNVEFFHRITGRSIDFSDESEAILHYLFNGAALIFAVPSQCKLLFGFDPTEGAFMEGYAAFVADLYHPSTLSSDDVKTRMAALGGDAVGKYS